VAADLDAWTRLLLLHDEPELAAAEPETIRAKLYHLPARLTAHARRRTLHLDRTWPWAHSFTIAWQRATQLPDDAGNPDGRDDLACPAHPPDHGHHGVDP
jgi:hypothetical protein